MINIDVIRDLRARYEGNINNAQNKLCRVCKLINEYNDILSQEELRNLLEQQKVIQRELHVLHNIINDFYDLEEIV